MKLFLRDSFFHLKRTICLLRRKHRREHYIGSFTKKGFRPVDVFQCDFCAEIRIPFAKRLGGKEG